MKLAKVTADNLAKDSNILELDVPAQLEKTISTGLPFLDDAMGGAGMTPSSCMLFTGTPGVGKTTLMLSLADALTKSGNIAFFNTNEENLYQVRKVTKRLQFQNGFIPGQHSLTPEAIKHLRWLQEKNPGKQVFGIFDSLQTHDDGKYGNGHTNSMTQVRVTEQITNWCKETFGIAIIVGQVTKSGDFAGKNEVKHMVDIHSHFFLDTQRNSETYGERLFEVQKNRFGCSGTKHILEMSSKGLREKVGSRI